MHWTLLVSDCLLGYKAEMNEQPYSEAPADWGLNLSRASAANQEPTSAPRILWCQVDELHPSLTLICQYEPPLITVAARHTSGVECAESFHPTVMPQMRLHPVDWQRSYDSALRLANRLVGEMQLNVAECL